MKKGAYKYFHAFWIKYNSTSNLLCSNLTKNTVRQWHVLAASSIQNTPPGQPLIYNSCTDDERRKETVQSDWRTPVLSICHWTRSIWTSSIPTSVFGNRTDIYAIARYKHRFARGKGKDTGQGNEIDEDELEDEEEEEEENEGDLSSLTYPEDRVLPDNYKEIKIHIKSLRIDAIISNGLNIARNKAEDYFLESKLRLNGERLLKKSKQVKVGDYVDLVMSVEDGQTKVKRVRILKVDEERTSGDKLKVTVRVWRTAVDISGNK